MVPDYSSASPAVTMQPSVPSSEPGAHRSLSSALPSSASAGGPPTNSLMSQMALFRGDATALIRSQQRSLLAAHLRLASAIASVEAATAGGVGESSPFIGSGLALPRHMLHNRQPLSLGLGLHQAQHSNGLDKPAHHGQLPSLPASSMNPLKLPKTALPGKLPTSMSAGLRAKLTPASLSRTLTSNPPKRLLAQPPKTVRPSKLSKSSSSGSVSSLSSDGEGNDKTKTPLLTPAVPSSVVIHQPDQSSPKKDDRTKLLMLLETAMAVDGSGVTNKSGAAPAPAVPSTPVHTGEASAPSFPSKPLATRTKKATAPLPRPRVASAPVPAASKGFPTLAARPNGAGATSPPTMAEILGTAPTKRPSTSRRKKARTFPQKLMDVLVNASNDRSVAWLPDGKSFVIVNPHSFVEECLPHAFKDIKYESFTRKLNRWNFVRLTSGNGTDCFTHPLFQRDRMDLCLKMVCRKSNNKANGNNATNNDESSPMKKAEAPTAAQAATKKPTVANKYQKGTPPKNPSLVGLESFLSGKRDRIAVAPPSPAMGGRTGGPLKKRPRTM